MQECQVSFFAMWYIATHGFNDHNCVKKVNKQVEEEIKNFEGLQNKKAGKQENS